MNRSYSQREAFIGNPMNRAGYLAGLVPGYFPQLNVWNEIGGTATQPSPVTFSLGGARTPMDEASYGHMTNLNIFWDMVGSGHSCYIYDIQVVRWRD